jgi:hypothetical protein
LAEGHRVDISIEIRDNDSEYVEASCPQLGLVTRAPSLEEALRRISRLVVYVASSLDEMPLTLTERREGQKRLSAAFGDKNFWLPLHPKVH